ncbi:uncharacterized protein LOC130936714 [Arachis stenosperma]|uniref:uncharacterized protein LOC130936714 n=1 Tax=Arachis stenosperma TaxID=217475 RepID=UPI0025ABFC69|nr:uncharacterized protein LOC130936714 [Arachis stenosperma]
MALEIEWYDIVCFGIVCVAFVGALWVLWMNEGASNRVFESMYESLLVTQPDNEVVVTVLPSGHVSTSQLWTSCWVGLNPFWLLLTRFLSFVIMVLFLAWDVVTYDATIFVYYTEWTFTLVIIYFGMGTMVSAHGCWNFCSKATIDSVKQTNGSVKLESRYAKVEFQQRAGFLGYLMQTTYQTCAGAVILTDVVFWVVIVPFLSISHLRLNMLMGCMHALNVVFLFLDTALNNLPFPWFRFSYFVIWSCGYIIFQWAIHACGFPWWPYPFLELNNKWAPLWYFCLAVIHIPCYGVYFLIVKAKNTLLSRLFPHAFFRPN